jgi:hypothetical protein
MDRSKGRLRRSVAVNESHIQVAQANGYEFWGDIVRKLKITST